MQQTVRARKLAPFPNVYLIDQLPAIFNDFFLNKVKLITTNRSTKTANTEQYYYRSDITYNFDSFHPVTITQLHTIITNSKPTSCALDPIPTSLLLECLDDILPTLTHIINTSILSGQFQTNMKTAIAKHLLRNDL